MMKNILLTGEPRSGKSSLLGKIIEKVVDKEGFLTKEILKEGKRVGFEVVGSGESHCVLASVNIKSKYKVSKYFVDVESFDKTLDELFNFYEGDLLYLDEIGQMELFSEKFKELVRNYLDSPNVFIGTISKVYHSDFIEEVRKRKDVSIFELNAQNREKKYGEILSLLKYLGVKVK